jgi:hypothetical protein
VQYSEREKTTGSPNRAEARSLERLNGRRGGDVYSTHNRITALQRSVGNQMVVELLSERSAHDQLMTPVQRTITRTGSADTLHGLDIDAMLSNPRSGQLRSLIELCSNLDTHLVFDVYTASQEEAGWTQIFVRGNNGRNYDLSYPDSVDWTMVDKECPITIKISMNSSRVSGKAQDVETLLHEVTVHAVEYVPLIKRMRDAHKSAIRGIWTHVMGDDGAGRSDREHQRLGEGFNRALSAEMDGMSRYLERSGRSGLSREYLDQEHWADMYSHHDYAPHYQGEP